MTKIQFLLSLNQQLSGLPREEVEERLRFYSEMIEDRMEEGLTEEDAVCAAGSVEEIAAQITAELQPVNTQDTQIPMKRNWKTWQILLLVLGAPLWISLLIAAFAVILALYLSLWAMIISLWAVFVALGASGIGCIAAGIGFIVSGNTTSGLVMLGAGLICVGLSIFAFLGCKAASKGTVLLTKKLATCSKKKEGA